MGGVVHCFGTIWFSPDYITHLLRLDAFHLACYGVGPHGEDQTLGCNYLFGRTGFAGLGLVVCGNVDDAVHFFGNLSS